ncbi:MAG: 4Fe-4S binding protein [Candidatus Bathyarchaeia archaeon]
MKRQKTRIILAILMVFLFPLIYYYFSPYLIIMGAFKGVIAGDVIAFAGLFVVSLFFGRSWCGWVCPAGATQELCSRVNNNFFNGKKRNLIKYLIWAPWLAIVAILFIQSGGVKSIDPLYETWNGLSVQNLTSAIMFAMIVGAIAVFALLAGKRAACHTICWMAPFMIIGRSILNHINSPALQIVADKSKCINCKACSRNCAMSLEVNAMVQKQSMENSECILCGTCVDGCPRGAIKYTFGRKSAD